MRICEKCGQNVRPSAPDPCLGGYLEGIAQACCGHGEANDYFAYCCGWSNCRPNQYSEEYGRIQDRPGYWVKRGKEAIEYMESIK